MENSKKVLIAPLHWGMGHTTRCMPIITLMLQQQYTVYVAATAAQRALLEQEYTQLHYITSPTVTVVYGKHKWHTIYKLFGVANAFVRNIKKEHSWLQQVVQQYGIQVVLSDNRYGLYTPLCHTIFITHQLQPRNVLGTIAIRLVQKKLYQYINQYHACWVLDEPKPHHIAGTLSHPKLMPTIPTTYIGITTRLTKVNGIILYKLCVLLSGPEPQRGILEHIILAQLPQLQVPYVLVRGVASNAVTIPNTPYSTHYNHLTATALSLVIAQSTYVLCRSGYTTIMDMLLLGKQCILVPTPGQSEQEYLANYLHHKGLALAIQQHALHLHTALHLANTYTYVPYTTPQSSILKQAVQSLQ